MSPPSPSKMRHSLTIEEEPPPPPVPWETILDLLSHLLDPKALATASCVSKSWNSVVSSDHLWKPLTLSRFPSVAASADHRSAIGLPHRRIFSLLSSARDRRRRVCVPRIALGDLIFAVDVFDSSGNPVVSISRSGGELVGRGGCDGSVLFRFEVDVDAGEPGMSRVAVEDGETVRVVWNVVMEGWKGAFLMMDGVGKGPWFFEELPGPAYCRSEASSSAGPGGGGVVAELGFGLEGRGGRVVEKICFGLLMSVGEWRLMRVDDALLYLQPFLLP